MTEHHPHATARRTPPSSDAAVEVEKLTVRYGGVVAVSEVSLRFSQGETCGLIGPNGAGKTTFFDCISGLTRSSSGRVLLRGRDITDTSPVARARAGMRRTFQRQQVFGRLTVIENLLAAMEWRGGGGGLVADLLALPSRRRQESQRRDRACEVLELCGLVDLKDTNAGSLPVGLARMVELARAVVDHPSVLLLDEPTSGLDEVEADRLGRAVARVSEAHDTAVLLVEHDVGFVMRNCQRIVVLNLGSVLAEGTPDEIRASQSVREAYLR